MLRTCESCGKKNRIPARHLASEGRCGSCKAALPALSTPLNVGPNQFREIVSGAKVPVLIDFWASWCGPCRLAAPEVDKVAALSAGEAIVVKVNTEKHPELAAEYGVRGIPNFVVLRDGEVTEQQAGLVSHEVMARWLR